jgi:Brp/Blh family beta-carotene 15,15'-monooxygenase
MANKYPVLYQLLRMVSLAFVVLGCLFPQWLQQYALVLALPMLFVGIPHGATDHLIFKNLNHEGSKRKSMVKFYLYYLGLMALYALIWQLSPVLGLGIFLGLSAYHFGQSNWNPFKSKSFLQTSIYLLWGSYVIAAPVLWHYQESRPILEAILKTTCPDNPAGWITSLPVFLGITLLSILAVLYSKKLISSQVFGAEVANLLILSLLFYYTPLLVGFGLYFAGWHSLSSILDQVAFFRSNQPDYNWRNYLSQTLPFTLLAGISMLLLWGMHESISLGVNMGLLFFGISLVTLPHMILIELLYNPHLQPHL